MTVDHTLEERLTHDQRVNALRMLEQGPDLPNGVGTMDDAMFTILLLLSGEVSSSSPLNLRAILDTGSPQCFTRE